MNSVGCFCLLIRVCLLGTPVVSVLTLLLDRISLLIGCDDCYLPRVNGFSWVFNKWFLFLRNTEPFWVSTKYDRSWTLLYFLEKNGVHRVVPVFHVEIDQPGLQIPFHTLSISHLWMKNISISTKLNKSMRVLLTWLNEH